MLLKFCFNGNKMFLHCLTNSLPSTVMADLLISWRMSSWDKFWYSGSLYVSLSSSSSPSLVRKGLLHGSQITLKIHVWIFCKAICRTTSENARTTFWHLLSIIRLRLSFSTSFKASRIILCKLSLDSPTWQDRPTDLFSSIVNSLSNCALLRQVSIYLLTAGSGTMWRVLFHESSIPRTRVEWKWD